MLKKLCVAVLVILFPVYAYTETILTRPVIGSIEYPTVELNPNGNRNVYATIVFELKISRDGELLDISVKKHNNVPEGRLNHFIDYFKDQLRQAEIIPAKENNVAVPSIIDHYVPWHLYAPEKTPTPTLSQKNETKENFDLKKFLSEKSILETGNNEIRLRDGTVLNIDNFRRKMDTRARELLGTDKPFVKKAKTALLVSNKYDPMSMNYYFTSIIATQGTFFQVFNTILPEKVSIKPITAYIFKSYEIYKKFREEFGVSDWAHGFYFGRLRIISGYVTHSNMMRVRETLIHETIHYMSDQFLFQNKRPPKWLTEGLAEYFECSRIGNRGKMLPGIVDHSKYATDDNAGYFYTSGRYKLKYLNTNKKELKGRLVQDLIMGKIHVNRESSSEEIKEFYAASFALVNFLLGSSKKGFNEDFLLYIQGIDQGKNPVLYFNELFGEFDEVEPELWKYIKKL